MKTWVAALRFMGVGWFVAISILLGVLGGLWLDGKFHPSGPLYVIVGLILGLVVAGYGVYQMLLPLIKNRQDKEDN